MISQENLIQYLTNTNFKKIVLPHSKVFTQKNYYEVKKQEMDAAIEQLSHLDKLTNVGSVIHKFQDDLEHKYRDLMKSNEDPNSHLSNVNKEGTADLAKAKRIDYDTYLSYNENEMISAPSFITDILICDTKVFKILLYGNKNPESYFKSMLILSEPGFMIKSKFERVAEICRVKKEIAFAVNNIFHAHKYNMLCNGNAGRYGFNKDKMVKTLLNMENYTDMPTFQVCADFMSKNTVILDIAKKAFQLFIQGPFDKILTGGIDLVSHLRSLSWNIIVVYNNAYLPVFCVDTHHLFKGESIINKLMTEYEWQNPELYVNTSCHKNISSSPITLNSSLECEITSPVNGSNTLESKLDLSVGDMTNIITDIDNMLIKSVKVENVSSRNSNTNESLKPFASYLLAELQNMAEENGIQIRKPGAKGTFKNKTKQELYDELLVKINGKTQ